MRPFRAAMRNPNLTGYGKTPKETEYLANLWLEGKWDMNMGKYMGGYDAY